MILARKGKTLEETVERLIEIKRKFLDEKLKSMKTEGKLKTVIQNKIQELDEMNFDTNSDPTGSDEKNQQEELEKLQDEKQKWMKTVVNLKTELQNMNQELELTGPITVEKVDKYGDNIRLQNISSEEIELDGWKLELQMNDREPATYIFEESFKLQAGEILTIFRSLSWSNKPPDSNNLEWSELMYWRSEDELQMKLISNDGETFRLL